MKIRPHVIISWPRNCDYPLFRQYIRDHREIFDQIHIVFTETHTGDDYREFIKQAMFQDWCLFMQAPYPQGTQDWRNLAVNEGLRHCIHGEWILFLEQDFTPLDGFWETVDRAVEDGHDFVGVMDEKRLHPCFLMVKTGTLKLTSMDFGIVPDRLDHFGKIQNDLFGIHAKGAEIGSGFYNHMNGLSHNYRLVSEGGLPNYKPEEFKKYAEDCLKVSVPLDPRFVGTIQGYLNKANG